MILVALLFLIAVRTATSDFVATFLLEEFTNLDNRILDGAQCDYFDVFGRQCDIKLKMCIEDLKNSASDWNCRTGWKESSIIQSDSDDIIFKSNTFYGDWPNPDRYLGSGNYIGVRMKCVAYDANFGNAPDYVIDQFQQVITLPIGTEGNEIKISHARPNLGPTTLRFQYSAVCEGSNNCVPTTPSTTTTTTTTTTTPAACNLQNVQFDIMEITDASANMGAANYAAVQTFLKSYVGQFSIGTGSGQTEFSSGFYASSANAWLLFYQQTLSGVRGLIDKWPYIGGDNALLDSGLSDENIVAGRNGYRSSSKHAVIVFGPGLNSGSNSNAVKYAQQLREKGIYVFAVVMGDRSPDMALLNQITGNSDYILQLDSASQLNSLARPWLNLQLCQIWNS